MNSGRGMYNGHITRISIYQLSQSQRRGDILTDEEEEYESDYTSSVD